MATVVKGSDIQGTPYTGSAEFAGTPGVSEEHGFREKARDKAEVLSGKAREKAVGQLDSRKSQFCSILSSVAEGLDRAGRDAEGVPRQVFETGSRYARQACDRLNASSTQELLNDVGEQLRARPAVFLAGLLGVGFLAGRMLKS